MATNSMSPSISQAPLGLGLMDIIEDDTPDVEILIENADGVEVGIDGIEIDLMPDEGNLGDEFGSNLAEFMDDGELEKLGSDLVCEVYSDINSRKDWVEMYVKGLDVLGMKY